MDAMMDFITPEYVREDGLAFQEQCKDLKYIAVDDNEEFDEYEYLQYIKKDDEDDKSVEGKKSCSKDNEEVSFEFKKNAVRFWIGCNKKIPHNLTRTQSLSKSFFFTSTATMEKPCGKW